MSIRVQFNALTLTVGFILRQQYSSNWHPLEYFLKHVSDTETSYCATKREILGCILALDHWWWYLIGKQFDVLTNYAPKQCILSQQKLSSRQVHWVEVIADYATNFVYKPDHVLSAPNTLSRIPAFYILDKNLALLEAIYLAQNVVLIKSLLILGIKLASPNLTSQ